MSQSIPKITWNEINTPELSCQLESSWKSVPELYEVGQEMTKMSHIVGRGLLSLGNVVHFQGLASSSLKLLPFEVSKDGGGSNGVNELVRHDVLRTEDFVA